MILLTIISKTATIILRIISTITMMILMMISMIFMIILMMISMTAMMMMMITEGRYSREGPRRSRKERFPELTPFPFLDLVVVSFGHLTI